MSTGVLGTKDTPVDKKAIPQRTTDQNFKL
jgi:hypothetical protein